MSISLTVEEIYDLAMFAGLMPNVFPSEADCEITIEKCPENGVLDDDGESQLFSKYIAYYTEYPEEGCFPLCDTVGPVKV